MCKDINETSRFKLNFSALAFSAGKNVFGTIDRGIYQMPIYSGKMVFFFNILLIFFSAFFFLISL